MPDCQVVELRQYTLHPGRRDDLIELFDREFVETQEAVGMKVIGQFRDLDDPEKFVWLRGFADMQARAHGLQAFYGGPAWAAHREAANATMVDSDDVLLLRPAWPGSGIAGSTRAGREAAAPARGALEIAILSLRAAADDALLSRCRTEVSGALTQAGARMVAWYVTDPSPNNFPRLPVREGENVVVAVSLFDDAQALAKAQGDDVWSPLGLPVRRLRLAPTARSALRIAS